MFQLRLYDCWVLRIPNPLSLRIKLSSSKILTLLSLILLEIWIVILDHIRRIMNNRCDLDHLRFVLNICDVIRLVLKVLLRESIWEPSHWLKRSSKILRDRVCACEIKLLFLWGFKVCLVWKVVRKADIRRFRSSWRALDVIWNVDLLSPFWFSNKVWLG